MRRSSWKCHRNPTAICSSYALIWYKNTSLHFHYLYSKDSESQHLSEGLFSSDQNALSINGNCDLKFHLQKSEISNFILWIYTWFILSYFSPSPGCGDEIHLPKDVSQSPAGSTAGFCSRLTAMLSFRNVPCTARYEELWKWSFTFYTEDISKLAPQKAKTVLVLLCSTIQNHHFLAAPQLAPLLASKPAPSRTALGRRDSPPPQSA